MSARTLVEFRKTLSSAHRKRISIAMRKRNSLKKKPLKTSLTSRSFLTEEHFDKVIEKADRVAGTASKVAKIYSTVAKANKDVELARRYRNALHPKSGLQVLGEAFDSGVRRSENVSRLGSRLVTPGGERTHKTSSIFDPDGRRIGSTKTIVTKASGLLSRFL